jgi:hypothetical protein
VTDDPSRPGWTPGPATPVVPARRDLESLTLLATDHRLRLGADDLTERFGGVFSRATVEACLVESYRLLPGRAG